MYARLIWISPPLRQTAPRRDGCGRLGDRPGIRVSRAGRPFRRVFFAPSHIRPRVHPCPLCGIYNFRRILDTSDGTSRIQGKSPLLLNCGAVQTQPHKLGFFSQYQRQRGERLVAPLAPSKSGICRMDGPLFRLIGYCHGDTVNPDAIASLRLHR